jgi:site-specific DNA recombinase
VTLSKGHSKVRDQPPGLRRSRSDGRRWLDELMTDATARTESIANREGCTVRQVHMTISLAFLAPSLIQAAIEGRLPHGMGVTRLRDLPAEWSRQLQVLGLSE